MYFARKYYGLGGALALKALLLFKYGTHFFRWAAVFGAAKVLRRNDHDAYTRLLLTKKTVELVFGLRPEGIGVGK